MRRSAQTLTAEALAAERTRRSAWLVSDRSALSIQAAYRGHLGRRRVALVHAAVELERSTREGWVEVRDAESGDVWFFNQATGESQWDMPEALQAAQPGADRVKKLPPLVPSDEPQGRDAEEILGSTARIRRHASSTSDSTGSLPAVEGSGRKKRSTTGGNSRPQSAGSTSLPNISPRRSREGTPAGRTEPREEVFTDGVTDYEDEMIEGGIHNSEDAQRLFLADGRVNANPLRATVNSTLKMARFDSVATLLMGPPGNAEPATTQAGNGSGLPPSVDGADRRPVIGGSKGKKAMVAQLRGKKSGGGQKRGRAQVGLSEAGAVRGVASLAVRDVSHPGFDLGSAGGPSSAPGGGNKPGAGPADAGKVSEVCFNCWSAGKGKYCAMHISEDRLEAGNAPGGSALMCKNWNLGVLVKRYRSEDIQEIFMKSAASLRYDKDRKRFVTVEEQKHPIYRGLSALLSSYNFTVRRKIHQAVWVRSLVEQLRTGKIKTAGAERSGGMLRLRNTMFNSRWVRQYATSVSHLHPRGPVTGTTLAERRGLVHHLVCKGEESFMFASPVPMPEALYLPRAYELPAPRSIPMPRPSYKSAPPVSAPNAFIQEADPAAWFERLAGRAAREAVSAACLQVAALSPVPGAELLRRTKYASPQTIKFASLARKPTPGLLAVGGLAAELTVHELVQTLVPPQFGNYTVMHKTSVAPDVSEEATATFEPLPPDTQRQVFVFRPLQHPLNSRRPPTIMVPTSASEFEKHYYGPNRPEQTGEEHAHGFRTSAFASGCDSILLKETTAQAFEPSGEVATPNLPAANQTVTTKVDHTYPFCEPSNRNNTTLDFYHLLLFGSCAPNKEQVFTNFGTQECGEFMRETDIDRPMGACVSNIYRSWAFVQRQLIEEFVTDDGLPYWFNRKTGETFWERPLAPEELVPIKEGGTVLDGAEASDAAGRTEDRVKKYRQDDIRKVILKKHENADDMLDRRKLAAQSAKWARQEGRLKPPKPKQNKDKRGTPPAIGASAATPVPATGSNRGGGGAPVPSMAGGSGGMAAGSHGPGATAPRALPPPALGASAFPPPGGHASGGAASVQSLTAALSGLLPQLQQSGAAVSPMDLVQLGMGLGMSLQTQGGAGQLQLPQAGGAGAATGQPPAVNFSSDPVSPAGAISPWSPDAETSAPAAALGGEPIGLVDPTGTGRTATMLDHGAEVAQREHFGQMDASLSTVEQYRGMVVVEATETPDDEVEGHIMHVSREEAAAAQVPVFAYPPELLGKDYNTHEVAGVGTAFVEEGGGENQNFVQGSKRALRRAGDVLPEGFFNAIYSTHVGKSAVDYLPTVPNLPQPRPVGRVKPRSAAEDWFAIGFDPWSAGKDPLSREFIPSLLTKEEALMEQARKRSDAAFIEVMDKDGQQAMEAESSEAQKLQGLFDEMASFARHSKYREMEEQMNSADYNLPIDYQDDGGNTLLHVTAQNGAKRIAKLLLRRGATINKQNMAGQTVLHYAQSYGFADLFEYFMSKGADDSLKNADGLTCYEGLDANDVAAI